MSKRRFNVCYAIKFKSTYGGEKTRWACIGKAFETARGYKMKLDSMPFNFDGELMLFEDTNYVQRAEPVTTAPYVAPEPAHEVSQPEDDIDDEIPF